MQRMTMILIALALIASLTAACAPASGDSSAGSGKLNVVATTGQITDALANIGGDAINLAGMLGPGVDPHLYVPSESDVTLLSEADAIFYNGLHLEAQMTRVLSQIAERGVIVTAVGDALPPQRLLNWDASAPYDPHIWNDPLLWSTVIEIMRDTLIEADPANADLYRRNADAYLATVAETHEYVQEQIARIPPDKRIMITAHDAFGYFARTYGLEVRGLQGISTESEAGTRDVQALADFIVQHQVPAIFVESSVPPRTIEAVQAAAQAKGFDVRIGGQLFSDALGTPGTPGGTYPGMLRHNAQTLADALSGQAASTQ